MQRPNASRTPRPTGLRLSRGAPLGAHRVADRGFLTETSWVPRRELTIDDWLRHGRSLGAIGRGSGWWIGDWVRFGNSRYGERYAVASRITGYDTQSLMNMAYVASRFSPSRRREKLSFSHHADLAALPFEEQERWLDRAERDRLSSHRLRQELRRAESPRRPRAAVEEEMVCPRCGHRLERSRHVLARTP
jgi:hypothetical protein